MLLNPAIANTMLCNTTTRIPNWGKGKGTHLCIIEVSVSKISHSLVAACFDSENPPSIINLPSIRIPTPASLLKPLKLVGQVYLSTLSSRLNSWI